MDMEPENFRGGGGGEAIGGRTGGPAYTSVDPAPLGFKGSSDDCRDRSSLYCLFIIVFKYLFVAVIFAIGSAFVVETYRRGSAQAGAKAVATIFSSSK
jgi:hypothetical protein